MVRKRKEDFTNYMSSALQNSMLTGIPQIASAANAPKRMLRALVFIMCVAGFVYQSITFMNMYFKYETVIDIKVDNPRTIELPSITFCNYNGLMTSKICEERDEISADCRNMTLETFGDWCSCVPRLCENGKVKNIMKPTTTFMSEMAFWEHKDYKKFLQPFEDLLVYCQYTFTSNEDVMDDCNLTHYQAMRCPSPRYDLPTSCYTINTLVGLPDGVQPEILANGFLILLLETMPEEYTIDAKIVSTQISFHHPRTVSNPYAYGTVMYPGTETIFRLKKIVKILLPPPYETNCKDYIAEWKSRGGFGPTDEKECIDECQKNASIEARGCIEQWYMIPGNERRCSGTTLSILQKSHECQKENCRPACREEIYQVSKDAQDSKNALQSIQTDVKKRNKYFFAKGILSDARQYHVRVTIFEGRLKGPGCTDTSVYHDKAMVNLKFDGYERTTYIYSPKFQNIETFSYVGGYVGMWLGISLVAVFDFLETVVIMCKFPLRRYLNYKMKQDRVHHIRKIQRTL